MRRYHFDLIATNHVTDSKGAILDDDGQARKIAMELAHDVCQGRPELIGRGCEILVRAENGDEITRVAIDQVAGHGDGPEP
jgi:hypothetical protein